MTDEIRLQGLRAYGYHGVFAEERERGQEFVVDLRLGLDLAPAAASDAVTDTVHYGELANSVVAAVERDPVDLIETLAARIADLVLQDARVQRVDVTIHKPSAPLEVAFGDVSVTLSRSRGVSG